ncbi:MAG: futalosine hydrolase [Ferruginibacter sp.]|nr:futalosine hydrolase [Ferruginibacter sp.]
MNILCLAATAFEIAPFLKEEPIADYLITGVGTPMTIYHIAKRLQQIDYDMVIQAGIAGSFTPGLQPGEIVFVKRDCFADLGITEQKVFSTIFEKGFTDENEFPFSKGWLENPNTFMDLFPFNQVTGVTVNTVTDDADQVRMLRTKFDAQVETMEGAALHFTCLNEKIPFIQLRSISNYVGERDKSKWKMEESIQVLNASLKDIVNHLTSGTTEQIKALTSDK